MFSAKGVKVEGFVSHGFEGVKNVFEKNFNDGDELSAQVCVYHRGEKVFKNDFSKQSLTSLN